jgi:cytochrome c oxidase subunit IV
MNSFTVWILLMTLTLFAFVVAKLTQTSQLFMTLLFFSTLFKGQLVIDYFMDLRFVNPLWRRIVMGWLLIVVGLISLLYYL